MTNIKESKMAKAVAAFVGVTSGLMMLGLVGLAPAHAQSDADLQAQIQSLLQTIAELQAQLDGDTTGDTVGACPASWTFSQSLGTGSEGTAVLNLQSFLNMDADTQLAQTGAGSPGQETTYYGPITANAVSRFQAKYSADVLAPLGLTSPTGYWGASSRAKAQELCADMDVEDPADDDDDDADDDDDEDVDEGDLEGGEASLEDFDDLNSPSNVDVAEGDTETVFGFEFDVEDADVRVARVDIEVEATNQSNEDEPWEHIEEVSLLDEDGDEIETVDASDEDDWSDEDNDVYSLRFTGISDVVREGDTATYYVAVTAEDGIDSSDLDQDWSVRVADDGVRAVDAAGINQYVGDASDSKTFTVEEAGQGEELNLSLNSDNPDSAILPVEEDDQSDDYGILIFDIEAEDGDITLEDLPVTLNFAATSSGSAVAFEDLVSDVYLEVDGEEYDHDDTHTETATSSVTLTFDDMDIEIDEDEELTFTLFVSFTQQSGNYDTGATVTGEVTSANFDNAEAEGANDLEASDLSGSALGEQHTLLTEGVFIEPVDTGAEKDSEDGADNDVATYTVEFDLTAFEGDFYVPKGALNSNTALSAEAGARFTVRDGDDAVVSATSSEVLQAGSNADNVGDAWRIDEGETATFTLTVELDSANYSAGFYKVQLEAAQWATTESEAEDGASGEEEVTATPAEDFETGVISLE